MKPPPRVGSLGAVLIAMAAAGTVTAFRAPPLAPSDPPGRAHALRGSAGQAPSPHSKQAGAGPASGRGNPRLPSEPGPFAPSWLRLAEGDQADAQRLATVSACADCHPGAVTQWRESAHAQASFANPYYRTVVEQVRASEGREASRFCAGCHEPALLLSGAIDRDVQPTDPLAHAGVSCLVCHGIREATADGNASYTLTTAPVPYPDPADPRSIEAHRERLAPTVLRTEALCGSCHRSFVGPHIGAPVHLAGIDDLGGWQGSPYAGSRSARVDGPRAERLCQDCHMAPERAPRDMSSGGGAIASHRFPGGHRTMAAQLGAPSQERAVRRQLSEAMAIHVTNLRRSEGAGRAVGSKLEPGASYEVDVVVYNRRVGHRFPGGTRDIQDSWVELTLRDGDGQAIARAGAGHATREDDTAFVLRAAPVDAQGRVEDRHEVHRFRGVAYDHTLPPRDAVVVRYSFTMPPGFGGGELWATARLRHRRHGRPMHEAACAASRSSRGRAFARAARRIGRQSFDACEPQPITEITRREVSFRSTGFGTARGGPPVDPALRLYRHALGLSHGVSERLDEARPSIQRALELTDATGIEPQLAELAARIAGRQGRLDEANSWLLRAAGRRPGEPAVARTRGRSHARLWQWPDAATALGEAARAGSRDPTLWAELAQAQASAGDAEAALSSAITGLELAPRHPALLRSQALALDELGRDARRARAAFLAHRRPDALPRLRRRCDEQEPTCARDRQPIVRIRMRPGSANVQRP